jgi:hypothetical protein
MGHPFAGVNSASSFLHMKSRPCRAPRVFTFGAPAATMSQASECPKLCFLHPQGANEAR